MATAIVRPPASGTEAADFAGARIPDVLRLRAWGLQVAAGQRDHDVPSASGASWRLFLYTERCALALRVLLGARARMLYPDGVAAIQAGVEREQARVTSARRQLQDLANAARALPSRAIVLKGGAHAAAGGMLDLGDLDLFVTPAAATRLEREMIRLGYARIAGHEGNPQRRLVRGDEIPVELHVRSPYGIDVTGAMQRAVPVDDVFHRLAPDDHLAHLLLHGGRDYGRLGSIRDLLLLAAAVRACSTAERERVLGALAAHPRSSVMIALYRMALELSEGVAPASRFTAAAAARCMVATELQQVTMPVQLHSRRMATTFALLDGGIGWRGALRMGWRDLDAASPTALLDWLLRAAPAVGRLVRVSGRAAALLAVTPGAWRLARRARRLAESA